VQTTTLCFCQDPFLIFPFGFSLQDFSTNIPYVKLQLSSESSVERWELSNVSANIAVAFLRVICIGLSIPVALCNIPYAFPISKHACYMLLLTRLPSSEQSTQYNLLDDQYTL
jgi:hypothetical protein